VGRLGRPVPSYTPSRSPAAHGIEGGTGENVYPLYPLSTVDATAVEFLPPPSRRPLTLHERRAIQRLNVWLGLSTLSTLSGQGERIFQRERARWGLPLPFLCPTCHLA
jgi:hypothetical protein